MGVKGMHRIMNTAKMGALLLVALGVFACSAKPASLIKYEKNGVSFSHFSDWKVTGDETNDGWRSIELEGPAESIVSFIVMPASTEMTLDAYASAMAHERKTGMTEPMFFGAIPPPKFTPTVREKTTAQVGGASQNGITHTFNVKLLGETVPHKSAFFMVADQHRKAFIITQVATEDIKRVTPGFNATLASFRLNKP